MQFCGSAAGSATGEPSLWAVGDPVPAWASGSSVLWGCCQGNWACCFAPSVTCGAVGAMGPAYTGMLVSLAFQGEGSRSYIRGDHGALSSCVWWEAYHQVMDPGSPGCFRGGDWECWAMSRSSHSSHG
jgi:hypothetical protein